MVAENNRTGERQSIDARALFVFIGAVPNMAWLAGTIELDDHGFIPAALYSMATVNNVAGPGAR